MGKNRYSPLRAALGVSLLLVVLAGCGPVAGIALPGSSATATAATGSPTPQANLDQRIDAYIATLTPAQQIGQTLMMAVYANGYNANLDQALTQWHLGSAIIFPNYNGGPLMPTTLAGMQQLIHDLQAHADTPLLLATDEEGGEVDRLSFYYGPTPSPQALAATGDPQQVFNQAQTDAQRMRDLGLNVDFAPLADVDQGGGIDAEPHLRHDSRRCHDLCGSLPRRLAAEWRRRHAEALAGAWRLQRQPRLHVCRPSPTHRISSTRLTSPHSEVLLSHQPDMIMVTHVIVPAYDTQTPASLSPVLVQQVLRGQLGYQGVVVTDAMDAQGLIQYMQQQGYADPAQGIAEACVRAFLAGDDLIEAPIEQDRLAAVVTAMTQAVASGRISQARLHEALHRIIALKVALGLLKLP